MTTESQKVFEEWADDLGDSPTDKYVSGNYEDENCHAAWLGWKARGKRIRAKLQSDEMLEKALKGFEDRYDKNYPRDTNKDYMKAAIAAALEKI